MSDNVHQNKDLKVGATAGAFPKQEDDAKTLVLGELSSEEWSPGVDDPPLNEDSQVPDTSGVDVDDSQVLQNSQPVFSPTEEFPDSQPVERVEENKEDPSPESPNIHDDKSVEDEGKDESAEGEEEEHATDDEVTGFLTMDDNGNLLQHGHVSDYSTSSCTSSRTSWLMRLVILRRRAPLLLQFRLQTRVPVKSVVGRVTLACAS